MKKRIIAIALSINLFAFPCYSGVPVLSPSELVQAVLEYTQILKDYEEQLTQVSQGYEQIAQLEREYKQALIEYDHLLEQAQAYKDTWGKYNWEKFLDEMAHYYANKTYTTNSDLENDPTYWENKTIYTTKYGKVVSWGQLKSQIESLGIKSGNVYLENTDTAYKQINSGVSQVGTVDDVNNYIASQLALLEKMEDKRLTLGDNSELATLQYIVKQNEEMMKIQLQKMQYDSELIRIADEKQHIINNKKINNQYRELLEIEENINTPLTIDNSRKILGNF